MLFNAALASLLSPLCSLCHLLRGASSKLTSPLTSLSASISNLLKGSQEFDKKATAVTSKSPS